jgi:hypothetical protein
MNASNKFDRIEFRCLAASLTLVLLCSCSGPKEKILGKWETKYNCTSKKGEKISYVGTQEFSKDGIVKDDGLLSVQVTDPQGRVVDTGISSRTTATWEIDDNKVSQKITNANFWTESIKVNSVSIYERTDMNNSIQSAILAHGIQDKMQEAIKAHNTHKYPIVKLDDKKLIVKDTSLEHLDNFDPGVCENLEYEKL